MCLRELHSRNCLMWSRCFFPILIVFKLSKILAAGFYVYLDIRTLLLNLKPIYINYARSFLLLRHYWEGDFKIWPVKPLFRSNSRRSDHHGHNLHLHSHSHFVTVNRLIIYSRYHKTSWHCVYIRIPV